MRWLQQVLCDLREVLRDLEKLFTRLRAVLEKGVLFLLSLWGVLKLFGVMFPPTS